MARATTSSNVGATTSSNGGATTSKWQQLTFADALRATAIFAVVLHHLVYLTRPTLGHERAVELGYLGIWGVNCFFVLSGFLLGRPYLAALIDAKRSFPSLRLFLSRRFFRIYPLYAVAVIVSIAFAFFLHTPPTTLDVVTHLTMTHTLFVDTATTLNGPLWTMPVDAEFYLVLPLIAGLLMLVVRGQTRSTRIAIVSVVLVAAVAFGALFRFYQYRHHPDAIPVFGADVVYVRNVFGFGGTFATGLGLALIVMLAKPGARAHKTLCAGLVVAGTVIAILQLVVRYQVPPGPSSLATILRFTFWEQIAAISVAMILYGLAEGRSTLLEAVTSSKLVGGLAAISYAVYLFHWPIITAAHVMLLHGNRGIVAFFEVAIVGGGLTILVATFAHRFIERPFLSIKDRLRENRPTP